MKTITSAFSILAVLLLVLSPIVAGCLSIPGPESSKKTPAVTTTVTGTKTVQTPLTKSPAAQVTPVKTTKAPVVTPVPVVTTKQSGYESETCTQQGGTVVTAGLQCTGTWLAATDTFSCCSSKPVAESGVNATEVLTVPPFNLTVNINDSPGSIRP
jgi:hypothetical protein